MSKTINKDGLVEFLQTHNIFADTSKKDTKEFVEDFFAMIAEAVSNGDTVKVPSFGKFEPYTKLDGTIKPKFIAFKDFKDLVTAA